MTGKRQRKRGKNMLRQLFEFQQFDLELNAPFCLDLKFTLRYTSICRTFQLATYPNLELEDLVDRSLIPNFILSQLESQKLITGEQPRVPVTPLLDFILCSIPPYLSRDDTVPFLFCWYSPRVHRRFYVFAYVHYNLAMLQSRPYSVQELLELRGFHSTPPLSAVAQSDNDLAEVITATRNNNAAHLNYEADHEIGSRATMDDNQGSSEHPIKDDSSSSSDEIVYKPDPNRRGAPRARVPAPMETEWKYHGRNSSEVPTAEPRPAPTGLSAQQTEGFRRFFKAVASPPNLRVTAGGRIVPNTRGPPSPTKRGKDKSPTEAQKDMDNDQANRPSQPHGPVPPMMKTPGVPMVAMSPHFYTSYPAAVPPMNSPIPMMAMPMPMPGMAVPPGYQLSSPGFNGGIASQPSIAGPLKEIHGNNVGDGKTGDGKATQTSASNKNDGGVKISPPEQFDHTKPFIYNGQWVCPMPPQYSQQMMPQQYMPQAYMAHPGYPVQPYAAPMMAPAPMGMSPLMAPVSFASPQPSMAAPVGHQNLAVPGTTTPVKPPNAPPISSIRPSEITRKQIESLRTALKYHENQLLYNRHQIDEREMDENVKMLRDQIAKFEKTRNTQLKFEEEYYPKQDKSSEDTSSSGHHAAKTSKSSRSGADRSDTASQGGSRQGSIRKKDNARPRSGINTVSFAPLEGGARLDDPTKRPGLPTGAALAPPFEPRPSLGGDEARGAIEKRLLSAGADSWTSWNSSPVRKVTYALPSPASQDHGNLGRPYLVGTLPEGINPQDAVDSDYVYERPLTDEEIRARFLYWGKAPLYARQGLPKYDGKNFYAASPIKEPSGSKPSRAFSTNFSPERIAQAELPPPATPIDDSGDQKKLASMENTPPKQPEEPKAIEKRVMKRAVTLSESETRSMETEDRRLGESARVKLLHDVLKRGIARSNEALPSTVTSTTAQGVMPQHTGHGSQSMTSLTGSPLRPSGYRITDNGSIILPPVEEDYGETRPHVSSNVGPSSLEEQFRNIVTVDNRNRAALPSYWKTA